MTAGLSCSAPFATGRRLDRHNPGHRVNRCGCRATTACAGDHPSRHSGRTVATDDRRQRVYDLRVNVARQYEAPLVEHPVNGDEELYAKPITCFSKGLPHNALGEALHDAYDALTVAIDGKIPFAEVPMGGQIELANPQAAYSYQMEGIDPYNLTLPPAPTFASEEIAGEMVELYWQALTRDVPFSHYGNEPLTADAISDLQAFSKFSTINADTLFRGATPPATWWGLISRSFSTCPSPTALRRLTSVTVSRWRAMTM